MPIYAYKCESCGLAKDALQKISDAPLTDCPSCGKPTLRKQVTAAGFQLKGSGWYVTDFKGGGAAATGAAAPSTDAGSASLTGAASEAAPAAASSASASSAASSSTSSTASANSASSATSAGKAAD